jgi:hypothetical protein
MTKKFAKSNGASNKSMGVSAEQRLSYQTCAASSDGLDGGFAPRHLRHSMPRGKIQFCIWLTKK